MGGFLIGEQALRHAGHPPIRIVGVQVYPGNVRMQTRLLIRWTERFLGVKDPVPEDRIAIDPSVLMGGFASFTDELSDECERVRAEEGIGVDPIFGGKTWHQMEHHRSRAAAELGSVLFWHCGYTPEWKDLRASESRQRR